MKICVWRLVKGAVPTMQQLMRRKVVNNSICPICQSEEESMLHRLKECHFSRQVWALSNISFKHWGLPVETVEEWVRRLYVDLDRTEWEFAMSLVWGLWYNCNQFVHQDSSSSALDTNRKNGFGDA